MVIDELHAWDFEKAAEVYAALQQQMATLPVCSPSRGREFAIFDRKTGKQIGGGFSTR